MIGMRLQSPYLIYRLAVLYLCVYPDKVLGQLAFAQRNFSIAHTKSLLVDGTIYRRNCRDLLVTSEDQQEPVVAEKTSTFQHKC